MADKLDELRFNSYTDIVDSATASFHYEYITRVREALDGLNQAIDEGFVRLRASANSGNIALCDRLLVSSAVQCALALKLKLLAPNPDSCRIPYKETRSILWNFTMGLPAIGERAYDEVPDLYSDIASKVNGAFAELSDLLLHFESYSDGIPNNAPLAFELLSQHAASSLPPPAGSALDLQDVETSTGKVIGTKFQSSQKHDFDE